MLGMSRSSGVATLELLPRGCCWEMGEGLLGLEALVLMADMAELAEPFSTEVVRLCRWPSAVMLVVSVLREGAGGVGVNDVKEGARAVFFLCSLEESLDFTDGVREVSVLVVVAVSELSPSGKCATVADLSSSTASGVDDRWGTLWDLCPPRAMSGSSVGSSIATLSSASAARSFSGSGSAGRVGCGVFLSGCQIPPRNRWSNVSVNGMSS
jgi:hypothetical protein